MGDDTGRSTSSRLVESSTGNVRSIHHDIAKHGSPPDWQGPIQRRGWCGQTILQLQARHREWLQS